MGPRDLLGLVIFGAFFPPKPTMMIKSPTLPLGTVRSRSVFLFYLFILEHEAIIRMGSSCSWPRRNKLGCVDLLRMPCVAQVPLLGSWHVFQISFHLLLPSPLHFVPTCNFGVGSQDNSLLHVVEDFFRPGVGFPTHH